MSINLGTVTFDLNDFIVTGTYFSTSGGGLMVLTKDVPSTAVLDFSLLRTMEADRGQSLLRINLAYTVSVANISSVSASLDIMEDTAAGRTIIPVATTPSGFGVTVGDYIGVLNLNTPMFDTDADNRLLRLTVVFLSSAVSSRVLLRSAEAEYDHQMISRSSPFYNSAPTTHIDEFPYEVTLPGQYVIDVGTTFTSSPGNRCVISMDNVSNVVLDLGNQEIVLDYCTGGGGPPYLTSNSPYEVRTSGICLKNCNNIRVQNGTIRGIAKADDKTTLTDWYGAYMQNVTNISFDRIHFKDLRRATHCEMSLLGDLSNNEAVKTTNCTFDDCIGRGDFGVFPEVVIDHPTLGQIYGKHAYLDGTNFSSPLLNLNTINRPIVLTNPIDASGPLINAGAIAGNIALCIRGVVTFPIKVLNCQAAGAVAVLIYNNVPGVFQPTSTTASGITIPTAGLQQADGINLGAISGTTAPLFGWENFKGRFEGLSFGGSFIGYQINGLKFVNNVVRNSTREYAIDPFYGGQVSGFGYSDFGYTSTLAYCNLFTVENNQFIRARLALTMIPSGEKHGGLILRNNNCLHVTGSDGTYPYWWTCCATSTCICSSQIIDGNTFKFEDNNGDPMFNTDFIFSPGMHSGIVSNNTFAMPNSGMGWTFECGLTAGANPGAGMADTVAVTGNTFQGNSLIHVSVLDGQGVVIENNKINSSNIPGNAGIALTPLTAPGSTNNVTICNNKINQCDTGALLNSGCLNTTIDSNSFSGCATNAIDIQGGASDTLVVLNRFLGNGTNLSDLGAGTVVPLVGTGININGP